MVKKLWLIILGAVVTVFIFLIAWGNSGTIDNSAVTEKILEDMVHLENKLDMLSAENAALKKQMLLLKSEQSMMKEAINQVYTKHKKLRENILSRQTYE